MNALHSLLISLVLISSMAICSPEWKQGPKLTITVTGKTSKKKFLLSKDELYLLGLSTKVGKEFPGGIDEAIERKITVHIKHDPQTFKALLDVIEKLFEELVPKTAPYPIGALKMAVHRNDKAVRSVIAQKISKDPESITKFISLCTVLPKSFFTEKLTKNAIKVLVENSTPLDSPKTE